MDSIRLPATLESIAEVRAFLKAKMKEWNLETRLAERVELALEEALVNISRYAYAGQGGDFEVRCALGDEGQLLMEIHDGGVPYNPLERGRPDPSLDLALVRGRAYASLLGASRGVGGWGVEFMRQMADDLQYTYIQGENILSLTFRPRETGPPVVPETKLG